MIDGGKVVQGGEDFLYFKYLYQDLKLKVNI